MSEEEFSPEILKPARLYHGSPRKDLVVLTPQAKTVRDKQEGPVVFATPRKDLALCFCVPTDDSWVSIGIANDGTCEIIISDRERFEELDKGGTVYELPPEDFSCDPNKGMGKLEWVSKSPVPVLEKTEYENILDALIKQGVRVYFVDPEFFEKYRNATIAEKDELIRTIVPENERRKKVKKINS